MNVEGNPATARRNVDAMPDGEHVIGVLPPRAAPASAAAESQITVGLNWLDEVRQRAPRR